jgi:hypothetical protein
MRSSTLPPRRAAAACRCATACCAGCREFEHSAFPAEYARDLLDVMHNDPTHNETWAAFWATQPGPDGVFTTEVRRWRRSRPSMGRQALQPPLRSALLS